jgi:hypothetical protein
LPSFSPLFQQQGLGPVGLEPTIVGLKDRSLSRLATTPFLQLVFSLCVSLIASGNKKSVSGFCPDRLDRTFLFGWLVGG